MSLLTAKNIAIFLALATTAFCVSTIVLAVQKAELEDDLQDALDKLDTISTAATPTTASTTSSTAATPTAESSVSTPEYPNSSTPGGGSEITTSDSISSPTPTLPSWPTAPQEDGPTFPTLPPGLPKPEEVIYRLPTDVRAIKYKIYIHPDLGNNTCDGTVSIQIEVDVATNLIVLHARDLEVDAITLLNMMGRMRIRIKQFYLAPEREMLFIELEELLYTATPYVVSVSYRCQLSGLSGIYASTYLDASGKERSHKESADYHNPLVQHWAKQALNSTEFV